MFNITDVCNASTFLGNIFSEITSGRQAIALAGIIIVVDSILEGEPYVTLFFLSHKKGFKVELVL